MYESILIFKTKAVADWKAAGGTDLIPADVMAAARNEIQALKAQGFTTQDIINGKHLVNANGGNGNGNGNAGGPNKMLLIGGAIAAVALLVLVLRK